MTSNVLTGALAALPRIANEDPLADELLPEGFQQKYEVKSFRNAASLLIAAHGEQMGELFGVLNSFEVSMADVLEPGGNKGRIAKKLEALLQPLGWNETRISGDLIVRRQSRVLNTPKKPKFKRAEEISLLENFLDGHQIDFVKGRIAFDLEWNSKDQTFDRDLYAMRAFYECGIIDAGVILTRATDLNAMLVDIASRLDALKSFKNKYGASTTWMGKLDYRVNAGRAGGCPILALGIKETVFCELEAWRATHPIIDKTATVESLMEDDQEG